MIYPFFSNIKITIKTDDSSLMCQEFSAKDIEVKVSFIIKNLEKTQIKSEDDEFANIEQVIFKLIFDYIPTPQREKRILLDQFHSLKYPENGYILRDSLLNSDYPYEWNGDHIFTNYVHLHQKLIESGYYVEILAESYNCFDSKNYKVLLVIDPEDYFTKSEIAKLRQDIEHNSLSVIIIADWYN